MTQPSDRPDFSELLEFISRGIAAQEATDRAIANAHVVEIIDGSPSVAWTCSCGFRAFAATRANAEKASALHVERAS